MQRVRTKRSTQAMYIPPARRALVKNKETTDVFKEPTENKEPSAKCKETLESNKEEELNNLLDMKKQRFTDDEVNKILSSFDSLTIENELSLIKFSKKIVQNINQSSNAVIEKLVVTLVKFGKMLNEDNQTELDCLIDIVRDKILEKETLPSTKRYLFHIVESRAKEFRLV